MVEGDVISAHLKLCGWELDHNGHLACKRYVRDRKDPTKRVERRYRVRIQKESCRIEVKALDSSYWLRIGGARFTDIRLIDGTLYIGSYRFHPEKEYT